MSESLLRNCRIDRMLPREAELVSERTGLPGEESVKRFERSNGRDTAYQDIHVLDTSLNHYFR